jgi:hypothetical protein
MATNEELTLAYLAGFFDGEGCIGMYDKGTSKGLKVTVAQIDSKPIELFQSVFGGNIGIQKAKPGYRNLSRLQYHGPKAKDVLANLYPYLIVKKERAAEALVS